MAMEKIITQNSFRLVLRVDPSGYIFELLKYI